MYTLYIHNEQKFIQSVLSGLDWTGLASDPLSRTGLDQDHRPTNLDWTGFFQKNPFRTLRRIRIEAVRYPPSTREKFRHLLQGLEKIR